MPHTLPTNCRHIYHNPPPRVMLNSFQHPYRIPHMKEILDQVQDDGLLM